MKIISITIVVLGLSACSQTQLSLNQAKQGEQLLAQTNYAQECNIYQAYEEGRKGLVYINQCQGHPKEQMIKNQWDQGYMSYILPFNQGNNGNGKGA